MAAAMVLGILAAYGGRTAFVVIAVVLSVVLCGALVIGVRWRALHCVAVLFFALGVGVTVNALGMDMAECVPGIGDSMVSESISGTVEKIRCGSGTTSVILGKCLLVAPDGGNDDNGGGTDIGKVLLYMDEIGDIGEGDRVLVDGRLGLFDPASNVGEFDSEKYYRSHGIYSKCNGKSITVLKKNENRILTVIFRLKSGMVQACKSLADEADAGVIMSVALGDKSELDGDIQGLYQRSGIAHILAISGLHISMVGMVAYGVLRWLGLGILESAAASICLIVAYGTMTGNATSAIRAVCMFSVGVNARVVGRKYDMITAAGLSAILILAEYPLLLFDSGFQLSFGAVLGIAVVFPVLRGLFPIDSDRLSGCIAARLVDAVLISISVSLVTIPVLLCSFHELPLYSLFLNMVVVPLMGLIMACSLGGCVVGMVFPLGGRFLFGTVHYTLTFVSWLCRLVSGLPNARLVPGDPTVAKLLVYYFLLFVLVILIWRLSGAGKKLVWLLGRGAAVLAIITVMLLVMLYTPVTSLQVRMLSVGQGDGILVRIPGGMTLLVDGGSSDNKSLGKYVLAPCIKASGADTIDYVFVSHADNDHISGVKYLVENQQSTGVKVGMLVVAANAVADAALEELKALCLGNGVSVALAGSDMDITGADGRFSIRLLYPAEQPATTDRNAASMVLRLEYGDFSMLFTGDLGSDGERRLVEDAAGSLRCSVLKVAHHGSRYSSGEDFLSAAKPQYAMISCGEGNSYGHPHTETLERLEDLGIDYGVTAFGGEIDITSNGNGYEVTRPKGLQ
jgi:competence protein ComEC